MRYMHLVAMLSFAVSVDAQFIKDVDEHGNVTYSDDPYYDYSHDESQPSDDLDQINEYLEQRDQAARHEQANQQSRESRISIERDPLGINQRIRYRKCRFLWSRGLKCL